MSEVAVVHTVASLDPESGGPARTVSALAVALEANGARVGLVSQAPRAGCPIPPAPPRTVWAPRGKLTKARAFVRALDEVVTNLSANLIHDHGIWLPTNHLTARLARRRGLLRVVSPRGMLDAWAMSWHGARKRLAWRLYQRDDLRRCEMLHATSDAEANGFRRCGLEQPVVVVPNGVSLPASRPRPRRSGAERVALFLSRVHAKKGLPDLIDAWAGLRPEGWRLRIVGAGDDRHSREVRARVRDLGLGEQVEVRGLVADEEKASLYAEADLFVLPTRSENFGLVVAEALAAGLPVLTTTAAPWALLHEARCGWWVEPGVEGIREGLRLAIDAGSETRREMGQRGRDVARQRFSWDVVARRMRGAYEWLLGAGPCTEDIRTAASPLVA